nr:GNAT family N-acetyltransferase [Roseococcus sp. MDT2-1-1]
MVADAPSHASDPADWNVRRLAASDLSRIERHLLGLDAADRRARFGLALGDAAVHAYAQRLDLERAVVFGAIDRLSGELLGIAEAQPVHFMHRVEVAVSVHPGHRRRGIGRLLVSAALAAAFARGAHVGEFVFAPANRPIVALMRSLDAWMAGTMDRAEIRRFSAATETAKTA